MTVLKANLFLQHITLATVTFFASSANSAVIVEEFSSITQNNSGTSTAVWNISSNTLHVPLVIDRNNGGGTEDDSIDIGTGADGAFNSSTYSNFDSDAPSTPNEILLDTNANTSFNFTSFTLDSGFTIRGTGTNPLIIRVQGDVNINGTIELTGNDGNDVSLTTTSTPDGGTSCCGGQTGGNGGRGSPVAAGSDGSEASANGRGRAGQSSSSNTLGQGAGGGGGGGHANYVPATNDGETPGGGGAGGTGGQVYNDGFISSLLGGSGGGGGGGYDGNAVANSDSSGGAGGGGGGALKIEAGGNIAVSATGIIRANGGAGGAQGGASTHAGAGGGGGGGAIALYSGGSVTNNGTIRAQGGAGGNGGNGGNGGAGADGRTRFETNLGTGIQGTGSENPAPQVANGQTYFGVSSFVIESNSYDTGSDDPIYISMVAEDNDGGSQTISYQIAGSDDNFASDNTGFVAQSLISQLDGKRYFKFRVTMQTSDRTTSAVITKITFNIFGGNFQFGIASCGRTTTPTNDPTSILLTLLYLALLLSIPKLIGRKLPSFLRTRTGKQEADSH